MNILPKKRWHVRTKDNIARVRRDEAEAAEKERQEKSRIEQADRELRLNVLKQRSKKQLESIDIPVTTEVIQTEQRTDDPRNSHEHINFFADIEHSVGTTNKDHDREVTEKKEEYEKKIGYLTYLGQDTNEALGKKNWYEVLPDPSRLSRPEYIKDTYDKLVLKDEDGKPKKRDSDLKHGAIDWKSKQCHDPINAFKKYCSKLQKSTNSYTTENNKKRGASNVISSKHKDTKSDKELKFQKLREARQKREQQEKKKTELFLTNLNGGETTKQKEETPNKIVPKYNSQFNPELARQNYR